MGTPLTSAEYDHLRDSARVSLPALIKRLEQIRIFSEKKFVRVPGATLAATENDAVVQADLDVLDADLTVVEAEIVALRARLHTAPNAKWGQ